MKSVALFGLPGVGKTKLGELAAQSLHLPFADGDREMIRYIRLREGGSVTDKDLVADKLETLGSEKFLEFEKTFYCSAFFQILQAISHNSAGSTIQNGVSTFLYNGVVAAFSGSATMVPEVVDYYKSQGTKFLLIQRPEEQVSKNCHARADGVSRIVGIEEHGSLEWVFKARRHAYAGLADSVLDLGTENSKTVNANRISVRIAELMNA